MIVDLIPYTHDDANQLVTLDGLAGSVVAISSASVYADAEGRTLDEATNIETFPCFPTPIRETQR